MDQTGDVPKVALVAIFNKQNEPILLRNYLSEFLQKETDIKLKVAETTLAGAEDDLVKV